MRGALKHHVLEEMSESGAALLLIPGTDVVPDVDCHRRRDVVRPGDDTQSVCQALLDNRVAKLVKRARGHAPHLSTPHTPRWPPGVYRLVDHSGDLCGFGVRVREAGDRLVGVEPTRIGDDPDAGAREQVGLLPAFGFGVGKRYAVSR